WAGLTYLSTRDHSILDVPVQLSQGWWGVALLVSIMVCRMFMACWVAVMERGWRRAMPWIAAILAFGVPAMLLYVLVRARRVHDFDHLFRRHESGKRAAVGYPLPTSTHYTVASVPPSNCADDEQAA